MKSKFARLAVVVLAVVALLVVGFAPAAAPEVFRPFNSAALTSSTNSASMAWRAAGADPDGADIFYDVVQSTDVNTISLKLQVSPDAKHWVDALTIASNVATDTTSFTTTTNIVGLYSRLVATVANTNPVTVSAWLVTH
jgi:hypothetical protein